MQAFVANTLAIAATLGAIAALYYPLVASSAALP
jgi:hypothetical protein